jgi:hypothetical protein
LGLRAFLQILKPWGPSCNIRELDKYAILDSKWTEMYFGQKRLKNFLTKNEPKRSKGLEIK